MAVHRSHLAEANARISIGRLIFSDAINWQLIAENYREMLKAADSIDARNLLPSAVLRRMRS